MKDLYITKIVQQGTSQGVVIPKAILQAYGWQRGDLVLFTVSSNGTLILRRLTDKDAQSLHQNVQ